MSREKKSTAEKCEAILRKIVEIVHKEDVDATLQADMWGENTLTFFLNNSHTHFGYPDCTFEEMIEDMHGNLCNGRGLSWHTDPARTGETEEK